jgi:hypothetical protein
MSSIVVIRTNTMEVTYRSRATSLLDRKSIRNIFDRLSHSKIHRNGLFLYFIVNFHWNVHHRCKLSNVVCVCVCVTLLIAVGLVCGICARKIEVYMPIAIRIFTILNCICWTAATKPYSNIQRYELDDQEEKTREHVRVFDVYLGILSAK